MLALLYLAAAVYLGDQFCRRFYQFVSVLHRWAAGIIVGLLVSSWFTYLAGLLFTRAKQPLLWGNALFFVAATTVLCWSLWQRKFRKVSQTSGDRSSATNLYLTRAQGAHIAHWLLIAGFAGLVSWMMFASFNTPGSKL